MLGCSLSPPGIRTACQVSLPQLHWLDLLSSPITSPPLHSLPFPFLRIPPPGPVRSSIFWYWFRTHETSLASGAAALGRKGSSVMGSLIQHTGKGPPGRLYMQGVREAEWMGQAGGDFPIAVHRQLMTLQVVSGLIAVVDQVIL